MRASTKLWGACCWGAGRHSPHRCRCDTDIQTVLGLICVWGLIEAPGLRCWVCVQVVRVCSEATARPVCLLLEVTASLRCAPFIRVYHGYHVPSQGSPPCLPVHTASSHPSQKTSSTPIRTPPYSTSTAPHATSTLFTSHHLGPHTLHHPLPRASLHLNTSHHPTSPATDTSRYPATPLTPHPSPPPPSQDTSITLVAPSLDLISWMRSPNFSELVFLVQAGGLRKHVHTDVMVAEDVAVADRCGQAFEAVLRIEAVSHVSPATYNQAVLQQRPQVGLGGRVGCDGL